MTKKIAFLPSAYISSRIVESKWKNRSNNTEATPFDAYVSIKVCINLGVSS